MLFLIVRVGGKSSLSGRHDYGKNCPNRKNRTKLYRQEFGSGTERWRVGILIFDRLAALDLAGPFEVLFRSLSDTVGCQMIGSLRISRTKNERITQTAKTRRKPILPDEVMW